MMTQNRVNLNTMFFLLLLQGMVALILFSWYAKLTPWPPTPSNEKVHVLLLSSWRSGSSFMGQVFNQHPSVFYLMEPAWHVWAKLRYCSAHILRTAVRDLVWSLFHCDFSDVESYLPEGHSVSSLFSWTQSRALCSPPACPLMAQHHISRCYNICQGQELHKIEKACSTYSHVVFKEVRFFDLECLYPLLQDPNLNLRIIHLVRDPRPVMYSRVRMNKHLKKGLNILMDHRNIPENEIHYVAMEKICRSHVHINKMGVKYPPPFLKGRYKIVRFEDITNHPLEEISAMFHFVGLHMTKQLVDWIYTMTHGAGRGESTGKRAFEITSRDAINVSQAWRTELPHKHVKHIQNVCKEAMSLFGYRTLNSSEEQRDFDIDLLLPLAQQTGAEHIKSNNTAFSKKDTSTNETTEE